MAHTLALENFSGPLDLLLSLIEEKKMAITEVALSHVTEQYLLYIDTLDEEKADEMADFLVVATRLLLLKAKNLLPQFGLEEEEGPSLAEQLRLYQAYVKVSRKIQKAWIKNERSSFRMEPIRKATGFVPPENATSKSFVHVFSHLLSRLKPLKPLPKVSIDRGVTLKEKIDTIRKLLSQRKEFSFSEVVNNKQNRTEVIVGFLALLELVKQKSVFLHQADTFSDIVIKRV